MLAQNQMINFSSYLACQLVKLLAALIPDSIPEIIAGHVSDLVSGFWVFLGYSCDQFGLGRLLADFHNQINWGSVNPGFKSTGKGHDSSSKSSSFVGTPYIVTNRSSLIRGWHLCGYVPRSSHISGSCWVLLTVHIMCHGLNVVSRPPCNGFPCNG